MKKMRIAALLLALLLTVTVFAGCDKVKIDDVKADPLKFITDGMALTLEGTPFANISDAAKKGSYQCVVEGETLSADCTLYLDTEAAKGALKLTTETPSEYDFNDEGEFVVTATEEISIDAYFADKQFAVKSDIIKDFMGTDAVGINLDIKEEDIKASALYNAILGAAGITEEDINAAEEKIDIDGIIKLFTEYADKCIALGTEAVEFGEIAEETVEIAGTEVKTIVVPYTIKEDIYDDLLDEAVKLVKELAKIAGEELTDEDIKDMKAEMEKSMPDYKAEGAYYISAKTGAVVKETSEVKFTMAVDEETETTFELEGEVVYGADPTAAFLPAINVTAKVDDEKVEISGKSEIKDGAFVFDGEVKLDGEEDTEGTFKFALDADGKYTLELKDDEEKVEITGTFTSDETKTELTADLSKAYSEDETAVFTDIKLVIEAGADVPKLPEYKDILDFTEEDLAPILSMLMMGGNEDMGGYEDYEMTVDDYYLELTYYYDETELDNELAKYASYGYETEDDMIYDLYIGVAKQDLIDYEYMTEDEINNAIVTMVNEGYSYKEMADAMYATLDAYLFSDMDFEY